MPTELTIQTTAATFPAGYCPRSNQQLADDIAAGQRSTVAADVSSITSETEPAEEFRDRTWIKINNINMVLGEYRFNTFENIWAKYHWPKNDVPVYLRQWFIGTLTQLLTYDGGENAAVTSKTGPFWEEDTDFQDRLPLGVGVIIATPATDAAILTAGAGAPQARSAYIIKPTNRRYDRG